MLRFLNFIQHGTGGDTKNLIKFWLICLPLLNAYPLKNAKDLLEFFFIFPPILNAKIKIRNLKNKN